MVFEPHTFSWRNRDTLSWYDTVFEGGQKILIYEPATQGATTHNQLSQEEIIKRVCGAGFDAVPIHSKEDGVRMLNTTLEPQDILLLLTSGDLGGLIEVIPELVTKKFPRS